MADLLRPPWSDVVSRPARPIWVLPPSPGFIPGWAIIWAFREARKRIERTAIRRARIVRALLAVAGRELVP